MWLHGVVRRRYVAAMVRREEESGRVYIESTFAPRARKIRFWKLKVKSKKLMNLRNIYPNMVVFELESSIFWSWFWIWTENIDI